MPSNIIQKMERITSAPRRVRKRCNKMSEGKRVYEAVRRGLHVDLSQIPPRGGGVIWRVAIDNCGCTLHCRRKASGKPKFTAADVSIHTGFYDRLREFCARSCAAMIIVVVVVAADLAATRAKPSPLHRQRQQMH